MIVRCEEPAEMITCNLPDHRLGCGAGECCIDMIGGVAALDLRLFHCTIP